MVTIPLALVMFVTAIESDVSCGAYCAYVCLRSLDQPVPDYSVFEADLGAPDPYRGYSMATLQEGLTKLGVYCVAVETDLEILEQLNDSCLAIALYDTGHFVTVFDMDDRFVYVADPPDTFEMPRDRFESRWTGKTLLVSNEPIEIPRSNRGAWTKALFISIAVSGVVLIVTLLVPKLFARNKSVG